MPGLRIKRRVDMHNVNVGRGFQPGDKGNELGARDVQGTGQEGDEFRENIVGGQKRPPLLPCLTIEGCRTLMVGLCAIDKMSPPPQYRQKC